MFGWLRSSRPSAPVAPFRFRPSFECLGGRALPSAGAVAGLDLEPGAGPAVPLLLGSLDDDSPLAAAAASADIADRPALAALLLERLGDAPSPATSGATSGTAAAVATDPGADRWDLARRVWAELGGPDRPLTGALIARLAEALRPEPGDRWDAPHRVLMEIRELDSAHEGLSHQSVPPHQQGARAGDAPGDARGPAAPAAVPRVMDPLPGTGVVPEFHPERWLVALADRIEPSAWPPAPPGASADLTPASAEAPQQPLPGSDNGGTATVLAPALIEGAGVITRFLPFDTAGLQDEVSNFLSGLDPVTQGVPEAMLGEWESVAAALTAAGAVLSAEMWRARCRNGKR